MRQMTNQNQVFSKSWNKDGYGWIVTVFVLYSGVEVYV